MTRWPIIAANWPEQPINAMNWNNDDWDQGESKRRKRRSADKQFPAHDGSGDGWDHSPKPRRGRLGWAALVISLLVVAVLALFALNRRQVPSAPATESAASTTPQPSVTPTALASIPTVLPTAVLPAAASTVVAGEVDESLYDLAFDLINESRLAAGLSPVGWDPLAAEAARQHVEEMIQYGYFSHWNLEGLGPEHRYTRAGGMNAVMENLHARASAQPPDNWLDVVREAHVDLMNSPSHQTNILDPAHTHVGIGIAFDLASGQFRMAQEFTHQYIQLDQWLPSRADRGARLALVGRVSDSPVGNLLLDLAWEPIPQPLAVAELNETQTYTSSARSFITESIEATFDREVVLDNNGQPGIYHIRLFGDMNGRQVLLFDHSVWVE